MLAVPDAIAGGVFFRRLFGFKFSVTVWVACFGMATSTGIIMLVYIREAVRSEPKSPPVRGRGVITTPTQGYDSILQFCLDVDTGAMAGECRYRRAQGMPAPSE